MKESKLKDPIRRIEGWGDYFISKAGIVYSCKLKNKAFLNGGLYPIKWKLSSKGYPEVGLFRKTDTDTNIRKFFRIHQLVINNWIEKPLDFNDTLYEANHKNGVKTDNRVENLEWMTRSENVLHSYHVLGREKLLRPITYDGVHYGSIVEFCKKNGFKQSSVNCILSRGRKTYFKKPISYAGVKGMGNVNL